MTRKRSIALTIAIVAAGVTATRRLTQNDAGPTGVLGPDETSALYDRLAPFYDLAASPYDLIGGRTLAKAAIERLGLQPGDTVLDLGTGTGWNLPHLSRRVGPAGHVIAIDLSEGMLKQARQRAKRDGLVNVEFVQCDIRDYEPQTPPNAVLATFSIEMLPDHDHVVARYVDTLAPGGRIATTGLRDAERWPEWLIDLAILLNRHFGVTDDYRSHRPWESIDRHTNDTWYEDRLGGVLYLAVGKKP